MFLIYCSCYFCTRCLWHFLYVFTFTPCMSIATSIFAHNLTNDKMAKRLTPVVSFCRWPTDRKRLFYDSVSGWNQSLKWRGVTKKWYDICTLTWTLFLFTKQFSIISVYKQNDATLRHVLQYFVKFNTYLKTGLLCNSHSSFTQEDLHLNKTPFSFKIPASSNRYLNSYKQVFRLKTAKSWFVNLENLFSLDVSSSSLTGNPC